MIDAEVSIAYFKSSFMMREGEDCYFVGWGDVGGD